MTVAGFQRARSAEAKQLREDAILDAARELGAERGIRQVTLTDIAGRVGMHKSALLRYFETREQIFLRLTAAGWREWSTDLRTSLAALTDLPAHAPLPGDPAHTAPPVAPAPATLPDRPPLPAGMPGSVAHALAASLVARPMFCDLLAQAPLNLERNVSVEAVRAFKLVTLEEVEAIADALKRALPGLADQDAVDLVAAATSLSGALWQMATPGAEIESLYRSDPRLSHAVVEVEPRVRRMLSSMIIGFLA